MGWARGGKGLEYNSDSSWGASGPHYDLTRSPDPFRFTASSWTSYVQRAASSGRISALSGCSVTPRPDCLLGHNEASPQWRAAINEHGHKRTAPEITECASYPLGIQEAWCMWVCVREWVWVGGWVGGCVWVYIYSLCILGHQGQTWLREELAQQNNTA